MKYTKNLAVLIAALFLMIGIAAPAHADDQVNNIFAKVNKINKGMKDYQANIDIQLHAKLALIPYNPKMSGKYYHKAPDKHKLVLEKAPSYLKKYPNIFGWNLPKLEKFNSRVTNTVTLNGQKVWHILLTPKQGMGDIINVEMWVNTENYEVPRQVTNYKNNGKLSVDVNYTTIDGYHVFDSMNAEFSFPKVSVNAKANANYTNYKFNQNLSDAFFADKK